MLVFSMLMGIIHLFAGLAMKAYQYAKQKAWLDILYDVGFWYMLLTGLVVFALSNQMFVGILQLSFILPVLAGTIGIAVAGRHFAHRRPGIPQPFQTAFKRRLRIVWRNRLSV